MAFPERLLQRIRNQERRPETRASATLVEEVGSITEHLQRLLNTRQGSVPILPDYGIPDFTNLPGDTLTESAMEMRDIICRVLKQYEPRLADVQVASTPNATEKPALAPSTTSPVTSVKPAPIQQAPQTSSAADKPPAPVALVSITEFRMDKGTTALPPANQVASSKDPVSTQPGKVALGAAEPSKTQAAPKDGIGTGKQPGEHGDQTGKGTATVAPAAVAAVAAPAAVAPAKVQAPATDSGSAINNPQTRVATKSATNDKTMPADDVENGVHVSLPPDGRYGAVVVGGSLSDMFPETDGIMTDRLTYTVYLQVGLPRAWIMQYSLPESSEHGINTIRPEAPYPYEIFRPKISPGEITTDAILVHGLVNRSGHFEQLDIVYPHRYAKAKSFLANMERWQFRPATQQGIPTTVEVLLIIPVN